MQYLVPFSVFIDMKRKKGFLYIMGVGMAMSALLASCADDESFSTS